MSIYAAHGINPTELTTFAGSPTSHTMSAMNLITLLGIAPFLEEGVFRLGLSFKKWQVALNCALIPVFVMWNLHTRLEWWGFILFLLAGGIVYWAVNSLTTQEFWSRLRNRWLITAIWITSIGFGLIHLIAFSTITLQLLPYIICTILMPFFMGCASAYLRVNLGFFYGVGLHIFNNIPGVIIIMMS